MLQAKEDIIKKVVTQRDEHSKNVLGSKDKAISELKNEIAELESTLDEKKSENKSLNEKVFLLDK